ncbi:unnamed protein product [Musa acuminata subsp. burmannicoides]
MQHSVFSSELTWSYLLWRLRSRGGASSGLVPRPPTFQVMEGAAGDFQYVDAHETMDVHYQHGAFGLTSSSGDAYSCYHNTDTFHEACGEQLTNLNPTGGPVQSPSIFYLGSYHGSGSHKGSMIPTSCSIGASRDFCNSLQKTPIMSRDSSFYFTEQHNTSTLQAQVQVSPNTKLLSISHRPQNSGATYLKTGNCSNSIITFPMMEQGLSSDAPSSSKFALLDSINKAESSEVVKAFIYGAERLHLPLSDLSCGKPSGLMHSFESEYLNDFVTNHPDLTPESSSLFHPEDVPVTRLCDQQPEHVMDDAAMQINQSVLDVMSVSSCLSEGDKSSCNMVTGINVKQAENSILAAVNSLVLESKSKENSSIPPTQLLSDNDQFNGMELNMRANSLVQELWDGVTMPVGHNSCSDMSAGISDCYSAMETGSIHGTDKGLFSESGLQQLLDAIAGDHFSKTSAYRSSANPISGLNLEHQFSTSVGGPSVYMNQVPSVCAPFMNSASDVLLPHCNPEIVHGSVKQAPSNSNIRLWIDDSCSINTESSVLSQSKKPEEAAKVKKRARPGESTRPRPKDRQQIQDRLNELREIVPNGAKCSIDALLDKTIKHMLFLQSVTKYADKLKQADEPKIISEQSGVVLKDNPGGASGGGATWAYEVAGQTMVCPIIVEDLTPSGQMLVEMVCEDRGLFLEIADIIRGFGLIILKGVMEIRECKIWARFLVEANREVTRMDIFLSLIQLLQQNSCLRSGDLASKVVNKGAPMFPSHHQSPVYSS